MASAVIDTGVGLASLVNGSRSGRGLSSKWYQEWAWPHLLSRKCCTLLLLTRSLSTSAAYENDWLFLNDRMMLNKSLSSWSRFLSFPIYRQTDRNVSKHGERQICEIL